MESRWYLSPEQNLETTKIEDRGHALHVTRDAWKKIAGHLDRNRLRQEAIDQEIAHKDALKKGSEDMTANWDNSVENIRKRKEEERVTRLEREETDKMQRFFKLRAEQEELRQQYISEARRKIYLTKEHPKALTSALILSEVLYEREKQLDLERKLHEHEVEETAKETERIKQGAILEVEEEKEKQRKNREKNLAMKEIYLKEINNREKTNKLLKQQSIDREKKDIVNMEKEYAHIKKIESEQEKNKKDNIKKEFIEFAKEQENAKNILELEDKEQDIIINIYSSAKKGIDCIRRKTLREMQAALQLRRDAASKKAIADAQAKGDNEGRIMRKAAEEREQEELARLKAKEITRLQLIKDRKEDRENFLKREEHRIFEESEVKKWDMLNRFKTNDIIQRYNQDKKIKEWDDTLKYRQVLLDQMTENAAQRAKMKEEDEKIFEQGQEKLKEDDEAFFKYADEVYEHAKRRNRETAPIARVIDEYKKLNNLQWQPRKICKD